MLEKRTDLALEVHELHGDASGIEINENTYKGINITTAVIKEGRGESLSGKPAGKYITLDVGEVWRMEPSRFVSVAEAVAREIENLMPRGDGCVLVAGLGNEQITPDSLGPRAVKKLLVTRHIRNIDKTLYESAGFGCLAAISPGVLGQTGIESAEIIKNVAFDVKPKCIIIIDSLASRRLSRLATTVQLSDGGINPGSGVSNKRTALTKSLLSAPVVSVGIPMVVDAATLAYDLLEEQHGGEDDGFSAIIEKILLSNGREMFVTPKDNDIIAEKTANLLATAINMAVHQLSYFELQSYLS